MLLVTQFPAVFAIERGNNDTFVVLLWTAAVALHVRERRFLAGCAAGLAAAAKLYPGVGCAVLLAGAAGAAFRGRRSLCRQSAAIQLAAGLLLAPAAVTLALWTQTRHYLERVLPAFAAHLPAESLHSHSVPATAGAGAWVVSAVIVAAWCVAAFLRMEKAPFEVFAGALAVSTYVAGTSFDYNLVTVHPLLIVLLARSVTVGVPPDTPPGFGLASSPKSLDQGSAGQVRWAERASFLVLLLGLASVTAHRGWFGERATLHVALQIAWVLAAAVLAAARRPESALQPAAEAR